MNFVGMKWKGVWNSDMKYESTYYSIAIGNTFYLHSIHAKEQFQY